MANLDMLEANFGRQVTQLGLVGDELFVLFGDYQLEVFDKSGFNPKQPIFLKDIPYPRFLTASQLNNCIYIGNSPLANFNSDDNCTYTVYTQPATIYRMDVTTRQFTHDWQVSGDYQPSGLSVTRESNLVVALSHRRVGEILDDVGIIREYTGNGEFIRDITLDDSIKSPGHAVKLLSGQFLVCQITSQPRVCLVNTNGGIAGLYGGLKGRDIGQLVEPRHLTVNSTGNVYVADCGSNRVELLSPTLEHILYVYEDSDTKQRGIFPHALHLDEANRRLYIGSKNGILMAINI